MLAIRLYWVLVPASKRGHCLFKVTCSQNVFQVTKKKEFSKGISALLERYHSPRSGYHLFQDGTDERKKMMLANGGIIEADLIADRLLKHLNHTK